MATITKRNNSYRITVSSGYDNEGKQKRYTMTFTPSSGLTEKQAEKEARRQAALFEERVRTGQYMDSSVKLQEFIELWFKDYAADRLRTKTIDRYKQLSKRICQSLGHLQLRSIQPHHIIEFYKLLSSNGQNEATGGALSPQTIKHYHGFLSSVLETAVKWGVILNNPCKRVDPPKVPKKELNFLDGDELRVLIAALDKEPIETKCLFYIAIYTGMRRSELLGLEWEDIDFENNLIHIRRTSQYTTKNGIYTDTTKTEQSKRTLKVMPSLMNIIKEHKTEQAKERLKLGDRWQNCNRLFTNLDGSPMALNTPYKRLQKLLEDNGLKQVTFHSLRHSNASLLIFQGTDIKTVSKRLGHSQTSTTMNIYTHQIKEADELAAEALELALTSNRA